MPGRSRRNSVSAPTRSSSMASRPTAIRRCGTRRCCGRSRGWRAPTAASPPGAPRVPCAKRSRTRASTSNCGPALPASGRCWWVATRRATRCGDTSRRRQYAGERSAVVIGAGLAGAASAHALARRGWSVRVVDSAPPGSGASALPWGLMHPQFAVDDNLLARLTRAGSAATARALERVAPQGAQAGRAVWQRDGFFQVVDPADAERWRSALAALAPAARVRRVAVGGAGRPSSRRRACTRGPVVARWPARLAPALDPRAARRPVDHLRAGGGRRARARRRRLAGAGNAPASPSRGRRS